MKKQAISACLAGAMLASTIAGPALAVSVDEFTDVKSTDWFYPYVQKVAEKDYMIGVGGNLFAPATQMSRAMFVTVLARLEGVDEESAKSNFDDVPDDTWYTSAVNWAAANGIVEGNGAGQFMPEDEITRQDMCTMMARYVAYHQKKHNVTHVKPGTEKTFTDEDQIAEYAAKFVDQCVAWGLIEGNDLGQFMPKSFTTRAEAAAVISRLSWKSNGGGGGGGVTPTPTPTPDIQTANYNVTLTLAVPETTVDIDPIFGRQYTNVTINEDGSIDNDPTLAVVARDLVSYGENVGMLKQCIEQALDRILGQTITQEVKGQTVTITVDDDGEISATMSVVVTNLTDAKSRTSLDDLEALVAQLQNGGTIRVDQLGDVEELLEKVTEVAGWSSGEYDNAIKDFVGGDAAREQMVSGLTYKNVIEAAETYKGALTTVKNDLEQAQNEGKESITLEEGVGMTVKVIMGAYLNSAVNKFNVEKDSAVTRLHTELETSAKAEGASYKWNETEAEAIYQLGNPANFFGAYTEQSETLQLKTVDDYYKMVQDNVVKVTSFYSNLEGNKAFYKDLLTRMENKYNSSDKDAYGVTCTYSDNFVEDMASLLSDQNGIFVDGSNEFRQDMNFEVEVTVNNETTYPNWLDLISGKFDQASALPSTLTGTLAQLIGTYKLTFSIDKD